MRWSEGGEGAAEMAGKWATGLDSLAYETTWGLSLTRTVLILMRVRETRPVCPPPLPPMGRGISSPRRRTLWTSSFRKLETSTPTEQRATCGDEGEAAARQEKFVILAAPDPIILTGTAYQTICMLLSPTGNHVWEMGGIDENNDSIQRSRPESIRRDHEQNVQ